MKNKKRVALYDPYLDTMGGGERHILQIIKVLSDENYHIEILWDNPAIKNDISRLGLALSDIHIVPNFFTKRSFLEKLKATARYDYLFYVTDGSYFFSQADKNYIFAMVPQKDLYKMSVLNKLKLRNYKFFANSHFTQKLLSKWGISTHVIYPYIDESYFTSRENNPKENSILAVGRFFPHLHSKNHELIIKTFLEIKKNVRELAHYKLYLVGKYQNEDESYVNKIKDIARKHDDIIIRTNLTQQELLELYKKAKVFWHFTGYGIDEEVYPQKVEHLGIAPLEAMAARCICFLYNAGGVKEIVSDGENGYLFENKDELMLKMSRVLQSETLQRQVVSKAWQFVRSNFSYEVFKKNVKVTLNL